MREDKKIQKQAIVRLVKKNFKKNRLRNIVLILAIMLVTILMIVMFGVGIIMMENMSQANLRIKGTEANGLLLN